MSGILLMVVGSLAVLIFYSLVAGADRREAIAIMLGLLWSSIAPAALLGIIFPVGRGVEGVLGTSVIYLFGTTTVTFFVGLPTFLVLRCLFAPGTWWVSAIVGLAIGLLTYWAVGGSLGNLEGRVGYGFSGAIAALGFWLIWRTAASPHSARGDRGCCWQESL